ncbi:hypothetical protein M6D81_31755 [Paenibacillus sp. J5C_2022]|nr:hypothetical protein [Paenibacillus sp. J5C2022]
MAKPKATTAQDNNAPIISKVTIKKLLNVYRAKSTLFQTSVKFPKSIGSGISCGGIAATAPLVFNDVETIQTKGKNMTTAPTIKKR